MLRQSLLFAVLGLGGVLVSSGCSGSTTDDGGAASVPKDQFISRFVDAVCDSVGPCCQNAGFTYDAAGCKALGNAELSKDFALDRPNVKYDAAAGGKCIEAVRKAVQSCSTIDIVGGPECSGVLAGTLPEGAACEASIECAAPAGAHAHYDSPGPDPQGVCVVEARGKTGDPCGATCTEHDSGSDCFGSSSSSGTAICYTNDGLYCDQTCKPLIAVGQPCEAEGCVDGAYCSGGSCTTLPAAGAPCAQGILCGEGLYCDEFTTCQPPKAEGQPCVSSFECVTEHCDAEGVCTKDSLASATLCSGQQAP